MGTETSTIDSLADLAADVKRTKATVRSIRDRMTLLRGQLEAAQDDLRIAAEAEYQAMQALIDAAASDG